MNKQVRRLVGVIVVIVAGALSYQFFLKDYVSWFQEWDGRVIDIHKLHDMSRQSDAPHAAEWKMYRYYWRVEMTGGETRNVQVPYRIWGAVSPAQRLVKTWGERWPKPQPMTPEDEQYAKDHNLLPEPEKEPEAAQEASSEAKYLEENAKKEGVVVLPSGLQYHVLAEGDGPSPKPEDRVRVHYRGTFVNGTEFDSSYGRGETAVFGVTQVIPGWTEALQLMKKGAKWRIVVPSQLAYGKNAPPQIGPDRTLLFDIELVDILPAGSQFGLPSGS